MKNKLAIAAIVIIVVLIAAHFAVHNLNPTDLLRELHGA